MYYVRKYGRGQAAGADQEWRKLDAFTRYSNVSAVDYHDIRLQMLAAQGISPDGAGIPPDVLEKLAELEHVRWCRYHYLHNWRYGVPDNGQRKDPVRRLHIALCPYEELTETDREKDREGVRALFELDLNGWK